MSLTLCFEWMIYGPSRNGNGIALWECWHGGMLALCNTLKTEEINKTQLSDFEFVKCWDDYLKWVKWWMGAYLGLMVHSWVCPYSYNIVHMYYIHLIHYDYDLKHNCIIYNGCGLRVFPEAMCIYSYGTRVERSEERRVGKEC